MASPIAQLVGLPLDDRVLDHVVQATFDTLAAAAARWDTPAPSPSRAARAAFRPFALRVLTGSRLPLSVALVALLYMRRASPSPGLLSHPMAPHALLVVSMILASKYTADHTIRISSWSRLARVFSPENLRAMERQFLTSMSFHLAVDERELLECHKALLDACDEEEDAPCEPYPCACAGSDSDPYLPLVPASASASLPQLSPPASASSPASSGPPTPPPSLVAPAPRRKALTHWLRTVAQGDAAEEKYAMPGYLPSGASPHLVM